MPPLRNGSSMYLNGSDKILRDMEDRFYFVSPSSSVQQSLSEDQEGEDGNDWDPEEIAQIPEPPDGGFGWVIVAASFLCNLIVDGIAYTFGIFFMEFVRYYDVPKGKVAWVGSLLSGFYLSVGPIVSALTNRFGCRVVTIAGSLVSCTAFVLSTMAPSIDVLMITYGVMGGIGFGMVFLPAVVSVGYYFSTKRALATGVAVCGSGMGAFIFAPFCQKLLEIYDWKGAMLILAGLTLNCSVFGALMRPLEPGPRQKPLLQRIAEEKERHRMDSLCESQYMIIQHSDGTVEKRPKFVLNLEPGVHSTLYLDQFGKSPADTPVFTLSPIQEARKSPASSKEDEMDEKEEKDEEKEEEEKEEVEEKVPLTGPSIPKVATTMSLPNAGSASAPHTSSGDQPDDPSSPHISNGGLPQTAIRELAKRKGLLPPFKGAMKLSLSNITVNNEMRRNNASLKISSSGFLCPAQQQNNNFNADEVWKQNVRDQASEMPVPLDASRRSSLRRDRRDYSRPMYRKDVFYSGSIRNLPEYKQSQGDVRSYVASVTSIPRDIPVSHSVLGDNRSVVMDGPSKPEVCPECLRLPKSMTDTMYEMLDFSLLKNNVFLLICISNIVGMIGFYVPYVYITDSSIMKGITSDKAAFLLSVIGITNTFGRLMFGWFADRPGVSALLVNNISIVLTGLCVFCLPFCSTYTAIVIDCVLFGLFVSAYICLTSIILVELLGLDKLTNAFGLLSLFRGGSCMLGPPIAGSIYDLTGSYDLPFFIAGVLLMISAGVSFMVPCAARLSEKNNAANNPEIVRDENQDVMSDDQESVV
ncbi:monocarboxylate transporter 12-like [Uloborus diversus]|uniref:monocarboxylate transporter 12-like n=1 Tax=Uloborus diversus TaxID=327109 RepID=UPI0024098B71|nr:monocarboxylate transporter 12-like [Uloborus diversus]